LVGGGRSVVPIDTFVFCGKICRYVLCIFVYLT
jgi:hypothetical protein